MGFGKPGTRYRIVQADGAAVSPDYGLSSVALTEIATGRRQWEVKKTMRANFARDAIERYQQSAQQTSLESSAPRNPKMLRYGKF